MVRSQENHDQATGSADTRWPSFPQMLKEGDCGHQHGVSSHVRSRELRCWVKGPTRSFLLL